ncbi:hypothetical protein D0Z07_1996 [Hyphodiscus hymeniophilus]|uniref:Uncharacterized protein n=1 Tax=Hyphodiscus hymeniophilus TaxID=353542 RepID=A0A9P6VPR9_9HELO|nr:hypothetical protein D0Z07_1996 [Hyphodiscus hymeniophilus]
MTDTVLAAPSISQASHHIQCTLPWLTSEHFLGPGEDEEYAEDVEDDGLGYYEDGAKRTLTNEQIAIFRHSEIEALLRDRRHAKEAEAEAYEIPTVKPNDSLMQENMSSLERSPAKNIDMVTEEPEEAELEDGEVDDELATLQVTTSQISRSQNSKKSKRKKNRNVNKVDQPVQPKGFFRQNVKPDLRKRTWDKVDAGLANLDYDEDTSSASMPNPATQRRRVSYDD